MAIGSGECSATLRYRAMISARLSGAIAAGAWTPSFVLLSESVCVGIRCSCNDVLLKRAPIRSYPIAFATGR